MSKSRRRKSRRRQKLRRRRRRTTRRRRKARGGGNKNIFKEYQKRDDAPYFKNKLYFPNGGARAETFTKSYNDELVDWMHDVLEDWIGDRVLSEWLSYDEEEELKSAISRCMIEILYDKIRAHENFIARKTLQCMGLAALILASKVLTEFDWAATSSWIRKGRSWSGRACRRKNLHAMEWDMFKTSNWRTCYKVQKRLGDEIAKGNIPFDKPEHRLWTAAEAHEQGVVPHITLTPAQLLTYQKQVDENHPAYLEGWKSIMSLPARR